MPTFRDLSGLGESVMDNYQQGKNQRRLDDTRKYMGAAAQGDKTALQNLYSVAPDQAMQMQSQQKADAIKIHDDMAHKIWIGASAIKSAPPEHKAQVYNQIYGAFSQDPMAAEFISHLPPQYDQNSAQEIDGTIDAVIAQSGMYGGQRNPTESPAGLRQFEAMAAHAGLKEGTPDYQKAAQIYLGQEARARNQVYDTDNGASIINMGGGQKPTATPIYEGQPEAPANPMQSGDTPLVKEAINNAIQQFNGDKDFAALAPFMKEKIARQYLQSEQDGTAFNMPLENGATPKPSQGNRVMPAKKGNDEVIPQALGDETLSGADYLASLKPQEASQVKALAEGRMQFPSGTALKSPYWQSMLDSVARYDPNFDGVNYNARAKTRSDFTSGKAAGNVRALNTLANHFKLLIGNAAKLGQSDYPAWNSVTNAYSKATGDESVTNFETSREGVANELATAFRAVGVAEADINAWREKLEASQSPKQFAGLATQLGEMIQGRIAALQDSYTQGMGTTKADRQFVTPENQKFFDSLHGNKAKAPAKIGRFTVEEQ